MRGSGVRVLVVGAGIAGLTAARALHGWGAEVEIVERSASASAGGTGIFLPGNAVRAFHDLGLGEEITARAVRIERQRLGDHRGRPLIDLDLAELWRGVGPSVALPRTDLHEILLAGVKEVPIRWATTPRSIRDTGAAVAVTFDDGSEAEHDLVLGADGVHSSVRRMIFGDAAVPRITAEAQRFMLSDLDAEPVWSGRIGLGASFLTIPVGDGVTYCYTDGPVDRLAGFAEPVPSLLLRATGTHAGPVEEVSLRAAATHAGPVEEVSLRDWSRGHVLLIGDAAHATPPNLAQGAAQAAEDAVVLADCLASAGTIAGALQAFGTRRQPRTEWVRIQTRRRDRNRNLPPLLRDPVLRRLGERLFHAAVRPLRERP